MGLGIDSIWNNQYQVTNGTDQLPIAFDVHLGTSFSTADYFVNVSASPGRSNMLKWNIFDSGLVAAHEYGYMFGLFDEYAGGAQNPDNPLLDHTSIMGNLFGEPKPRHYQGFVDWIEERTDQSWQLVAWETPTSLHETPDPSTFLLVGSGCLVLIALRVKKLRGSHSATHSWFLSSLQPATFKRHLLEISAPCRSVEGQGPETDFQLQIA